MPTCFIWSEIDRKSTEIERKRASFFAIYLPFLESQKVGIDHFCCVLILRFWLFTRRFTCRNCNKSVDFDHVLVYIVYINDFRSYFAKLCFVCDTFEAPWRQTRNILPLAPNKASQLEWHFSPKTSHFVSVGAPCIRRWSKTFKMWAIFKGSLLEDGPHFIWANSQRI